MIEVSMTMNGVEQWLAGVDNFERLSEQNAADEFVKLAQKIVEEIRLNYVPVDVGRTGPHSKSIKPSLISQTLGLKVQGGTLRDSVDCDEVARFNAEGFEVSIWAGREGSGAERYAWIQHENLMYRHNVGQAKYVEIPVAMIATPGSVVALIEAIKKTVADNAWG